MDRYIRMQMQGGPNSSRNPITQEDLSITPFTKHMQKMSVVASVDKEVEQIVKSTAEPVSARGLKIPLNEEMQSHTKSC